MADIAIFRINYKSDFILTLQSDAGWMIPFCIKFWTGAPSQAYYAYYDGMNYTHCAPVEGEPTKLLVQFDDHHLPIGDLKFQIGYHFTVDDFPTSVEDEVLNQASVIIEVDDAPAQVMLDLNGETAPEIEFSLPAYTNEQQRIANEQQRIANEQTRIANEEARIAAETIRQQNEEQRIEHETARVDEFAQLKRDSEQATSDANTAANLANEKAQLAADKAALAQAAATLAGDKAQLADDKAALAQAAATLANEKAALAQQKSEYAQTQGNYANTQGDYAKNQGDYAKEQGNTAKSDHVRAEADHAAAADDHQTAAADHITATADHSTAASDHTRAEADHTTASSDHSRAESDHTTAASDHTRAESDHTTAESDHETAASDHTRAESDHVAVEVYVDSLGVFDLSKHNAVDGVLATYADLSAALTALNALDSKYKYGGMSFKFVHTSDNKYVQYRLMATTWSTYIYNWQQSDVVDTYNQGISDLDISDEDGNILVRFQGGGIKTKDFDSSQDATESARGLMSAIDKIKLNSIEQGAEVNDVVTSNQLVSDLDISDEDGEILVRFQNGGIKTKYFDSFNPSKYESYQRRVPFSQRVNITNFLVTDFVSENINTYEDATYYDDNCVLYLPESYTVNGSPTKLIIFCKQGVSTIELSEDTILTNENTGRIFRYMLKLGYGILAADGVPNGWADALGLGERVVGNYVAVQSTIRAFEYVSKNYNIDKEGVFIFGYSQGGHYAQNVIDNSNLPIAAAAEVSPVCSIRYHQWDLNSSEVVDGVSFSKSARLNVARIFDYPAVTNDAELLALEYDPTKTVGYDPWTRNVDNPYDNFIQDGNLWKFPNGTTVDDITMKKHLRCPLKIWAADNDTKLGVDVMKAFIKGVKNSGQVADIQLFTTGGHSIPANQTSIGTFVENGEICNLYPIAKDIAIWFYNFGGYELL